MMPCTNTVKQVSVVEVCTVSVCWCGWELLGKLVYAYRLGCIARQSDKRKKALHTVLITAFPWAVSVSA